MRHMCRKGINQESHRQAFIWFVCLERGPIAPLHPSLWGQTCRQVGRQATTQPGWLAGRRADGAISNRQAGTQHRLGVQCAFAGCLCQPTVVAIRERDSPLLHVTVGGTRVVDEAGDVAFVASVNNHTVADLER